MRIGAGVPCPQVLPPYDGVITVLPFWKNAEKERAEQAQDAPAWTPLL